MVTTPSSVRERDRLARERAPTRTVATVLVIIALAVTSVLTWAALRGARHSGERPSSEGTR